MSVSFTCRPVTAANWPDLERLFEERGGPKYCWCMPFRVMEAGGDRGVRTDLKGSLHGHVQRNTPIGLLAYADDKPVAWCSIAPRDTYRGLGGVGTKERVWSLACFFIRRDHRGQGMVERLIGAAAAYARENDAEVLEAYPVDPDSPSYRFMGFVPTFERLGFALHHMEGKRRHVMTLKLR